jgi:two-component system nitrogen regulation response regulator GlnG
MAREEAIDRATVEAVLGADGEPAPRDAPSALADALAGWLRDCAPPEGQVYDAVIAEIERPLFAHALAQTGGNQLRAARVLGINRNTLRKRLTDLAIDPEACARHS